MNATAKELGALDTTATNPTGLDAKHQLSSAFDLAIFAREGLQNRDFRRYVSTVSTSFPAQEPKKANKKRDSYMIYNQNPLLINGYRGILGVKTGYTTEAGRTYVAAAERGGRTLIVSLMGIIEPTELAAERLLAWGWNHGDSVESVGSLESPKPRHTGTSSPTTTTLAQPTVDGPTDAGEGSSAPSLMLWLAAGMAMIGVGWWLQRRRARPR
jgi:D-alanyl-D-alanine carboxypeptidase (penicillin-binding protein 5/6)